MQNNRVYRAAPAWTPRCGTKLGAVTRAGRLQKSIGIDRRRLRDLGEYAVVYVTAGSGYFVDDRGLDVAVNAGGMLILFPGVGHAYGPDRGGYWEEIYLCFSGPMFDSMRDSGLLDPANPVISLGAMDRSKKDEDLDYWEEQVAGVLRIPHGRGVKPGVEPSDVEVGRMVALLTRVMAVDGPGASEQGWADRVCRALEKDLSGEVDLCEMAEAEGMSYEGFRKKFSRLVGVPPARYRQRQVMMRACELMHDQTLSDKQIAYRLGFCDPYYFSRQFKKVVGVSPSRYRGMIGVQA